jgi:hypothetical protein
VSTQQLLLLLALPLLTVAALQTSQLQKPLPPLPKLLLLLLLLITACQNQQTHTCCLRSGGGCYAVVSCTQTCPDLLEFDSVMHCLVEAAHRCCR